jgi:hypothetical protein
MENKPLFKSLNNLLNPLNFSSKKFIVLFFLSLKKDMQESTTLNLINMIKLIKKVLKPFVGIIVYSFVKYYKMYYKPSLPKVTNKKQSNIYNKPSEISSWIKLIYQNLSSPKPSPNIHNKRMIKNSSQIKNNIKEPINQNKPIPSSPKKWKNETKTSK